MKASINLNGLAGAKGKTRADQDKIDDTMARGCAIGIVSSRFCEIHTVASDERLSELAGQK